MKKVQKAVKNLCDAYGGQSAFAKKIGVSRQTVCDVMAGRSRTGFEFLSKCRKQGIDVNIFFD